MVPATDPNGLRHQTMEADDAPISRFQHPTERILGRARRIVQPAMFTKLAEFVGRRFGIGREHAGAHWQDGGYVVQGRRPT